jgi:hypothetical protein
VTDRAEVTVTVQVLPETESHPLQLPKNMVGVAVSVTTVPLVYVSEQSAPQLIPGGLEVTLPWPLTRPVLFTVRVKVFRLKAAVAVLPELTVTVHVAPETVSHPLQPAKVESLAALAVKVTTVPLAKDSEQSVPQLIPGGLEVTVPVPAPVRKTVRLASPTTVSVVLALAPEASVAVIVVVPAPTPVARPVASMVATAVLLLVQVTPVPLMVTGLGEFVVVPFPSCPHWLSPQHRTVPSPRSAQLWCHHPAVTATAPVIPLTGTGVVRRVVVPSPSCPDVFSPQHWTELSPRSAQV